MSLDILLVTIGYTVGNTLGIATTISKKNKTRHNIGTIRYNTDTT